LAPQQPGAPTLEQFGYKQELNRALSTRDLIVHGMIFMGPIAPFAVFGFVWNDARGMVALAYLIGLLGMSFTAMSYAEMSRAFPMAGSVYSYVQRGLHETAGFFSGWLILLDYILVPALCYVFAVLALRPLLPQVPDRAWIVVFVTLNALINLRGVQLGARVNRGILLVAVATLGLFIVLGLRALYAGPGAAGLTLRPVYDPAAFSLATVAAATSTAVLSFLGFDAVSTLAEENRDGRNAVGRATLWSLVLVGLLFIVQTWIAADLARGMHLHTETAFYEVAERVGGVWLRDLALLAIVLASLANALAGQSAISRILFSMARDGKLPAVLARVHPRYRTPHVSTLVVAVVSLLVCLFFARRAEDLSRVVNFGALTGFLMLQLAVINYYLIRGRSKDWLRHLLVPLGGLVVIGYVLYQMDSAAKIMGACWIAAGVLYYLGLTAVLRKPPALEISERS